MTETGEHEVIGLERAALGRWCRGDPSGFLEISDEAVTYFDPFIPHRIDGLQALTAYYEALRGKIFAATWEIVAPAVAEIGEVAVLTFRFVSRGADGGTARWNCTEVYRRREAGWRIVQTHWSFTAPEGAS